MARPRVVIRQVGGRGRDADVPAPPEDEVGRDADDGPIEVVLADSTDIGTVVDAVLRGRDATVWISGDRTLRATAIDELGRIADVVDEHADAGASVPSSATKGGGPSRSAVAKLDAEHQRLIALVADGSTITEAGREIGISRRTAARRMATVRSVLGVATNAEAVVAWTSRRRGPDSL